MARVRVDSIGCRLNTSEIEDLARRLSAAGHRIVGPGEEIDLCIFNTCTVTAVASRKSRQFIRQLRRANPTAKVVVTGCLAELEAEEIRRLGVDSVVGNRDKDRLPEILDAAGILSGPDDTAHDGAADADTLSPLRTRAFVKVQDGCDNHCTFCVVTLARGEGRSTPLQQVVEQVRELEAGGYQEIVLSGVHLGSYGHDIGRTDGLQHLVREILASTTVPRLRLSSLEPWDLQPDFFELFADQRLLPHLHLPLQAGCDRTLRRMARRITTGGFRTLVDSARAQVPDLAVSTDVMVGFPGESAEEFRESLDFVRAMAFSRLHVFRYSPRRGTAAAAFPEQVPGPVAQERSRQMHELGAELERRFMESMLTRTVPVLWEQLEHGPAVDEWTGLTPNYQRVVARADDATELTNRITAAHIRSVRPGALVASLC